MQLVIQLPGLVQAKMNYEFSFDLFHPGIKEMIRLMAPRLLNAVILYFSVGVNRNLLGLVNQDGATYGYVTAFSLILLPTGIFGMAVSQAAFPTLAAYVAAGQLDRLTDDGHTDDTWHHLSGGALVVRHDGAGRADHSGGHWPRTRRRSEPSSRSHMCR